MIRFKIDLTKDKLLWEDIITIDVNENSSHAKHPEYSTHLIRLYENCDNEKYYLFIQPKVNHENWERCNEWIEPSSNYSSWGKFIMNYSKPHYQSLRKVIKFDDDTPFFCLYGIDLYSYQDSILRENMLPLSVDYRK